MTSMPFILKEIVDLISSDILFKELVACPSFNSRWYPLNLRLENYDEIIPVPYLNLDCFQSWSLNKINLAFFR